MAERVLALVGHEEVTREPWFATGAGRAAHADLLDRLVGKWIGDRDLDDVLSAFAAADAAASPIYSIADAVSDPQYQALDTFVHVDDPELGPTLMQNVLFRLSATPGDIRWSGRALGADNESVYCGELRLTSDQLADLRSRNVI